MTEPILVARDLRRHHTLGSGVVRALDGVDLELRPAELVALTGASGSGKTSLLHVLVGWEQADAGEVRWAFLDADRGDPANVTAWHDLAVLPQRLGLMEEISIRENISMPVRLAPGRDTEDVGALLTELGLDALAERLPDEASLGEQQRAALARALVLRPRVLLADEPTGHQDERWAAGVVEALRRRCARGMAAIAVSHDPLILRGADRVVTMADGRIVGDAVGGGEPGAGP